MSSNSTGRKIRDDAYPLPVAVGKRRMVILADGCFSPLGAKTAVCLVRYVPEEVVAVIDSSKAPATVGGVLGWGGTIPVVANLDEALTANPDCLVLGTAPRGGMLPPNARRTIVAAIRSGLHIISGMHQFLGDDGELAALVREHGVTLWDVRKPPDDLGVSSGNECPFCPVILTVGSDCNTGKMTASMEITHALRAAGLKVGFAASGQTGIMITGRGIPIDRVVADFIGGATERLVCEAAPGMDVVILEGQGSLIHPGYAGVTVGMISGALPKGAILCHQPTRTMVREYQIPIPPLSRLVSIYECAIEGIKRVPVLGIALNTFDLDDRDAQAAIESAARETGLPAADPVRFTAGPLVTAIRRSLR
ncbi:MAG: DUF1611 domain-containing protein [bacterium]|nr:MAG: DUF1611 domain-containing protein [bacterium]